MTKWVRASFGVLLTCYYMGRNQIHTMVLG